MALQQLYDACKVTFAGDGPSQEGLQTVTKLIDAITPTDLQLNIETLNQQDRGFGFFGKLSGRGSLHSSMVARWAPPISYLHIHECRNFSMGIFCLPTSAVIPLHDHPGMIVLSKLLYGSMHVKAYDWVDRSELKIGNGSEHSRAARLVVDQVSSAPCKSSILYPSSGGNIHSFTGITSCAVLDILAPPYSVKENRNCTYYRDFPYSGVLENTRIPSHEEGLAWLEEFQPPADFDVKWVPYEPPRITL